MRMLGVGGKVSLISFPGWVARVGTGAEIKEEGPVLGKSSQV